MKKHFIFLSFVFFCFTVSKAQNVGIGTTSPNAPFNVALNKTVLFGDDTSNSSGTNKFIWFPATGALRAGLLSSSDIFSVYSTAFGYHSIASGQYSTASGYYSAASGDYSIASGDQATASGSFSVAIGNHTTANGSASSAFGQNTNATGDYSTAMGNGTTASGLASTAFGVGSTADGFRSTAMGHGASTGGHSHSFCISGGSASASPYNVINTADYQMMMYFDTYTFWSGTGGQGVDLPNNSNSWVSHCDKNKKENFEPLNGEDVLNKISKINFSSWNYKGLDPKKYRHYGIMAQDFYAAFGKDKYGIIGTDTTVNPIDMIGIDMTAIQALEKRTEKIELLENKNREIESENAALLARVENMAAEIKKLQQAMEALALKDKTKNSNMVKN